MAENETKNMGNMLQDEWRNVIDGGFFVVCVIFDRRGFVMFEFFVVLFSMLKL